MTRPNRFALAALLALSTLLAAVPAIAQVPRSIFVEFGSATW
jgi:hypothetical protein